MNKLLLTFYGDDFTGSTDALEQLSVAGIRAMLFIKPPTPARMKKFPGLQAVGVAGMTRSLSPAAMERKLKPALTALKSLGARHVHYKVCSTFDSSPTVGNIGRVIEVASKIFNGPFVPLLVAAPALGRFTVFGTHFARYGIGSAGEIHRLDRHPSISKHPVTPMNEADLRLHLSKQTKRKIALFDILKVNLPEQESRAALMETLSGKPDVVLFDALDAANIRRVGGLIDEYAHARRPLFSVGSSGIETALVSHWAKPRPELPKAMPVEQILVGSGSCSPVTSGQISMALKNGFTEVALNATALVANKTARSQIDRAVKIASRHLLGGQSVIVHTTRSGSDAGISAKLKNGPPGALGMALGNVLRRILENSKVRRLCIVGGDTCSFAAGALGIESLEMLAPLTPGAPLCRAFAPGSPLDGMEVVFKGGQVGGENYFETVKRGGI